MIVSNVSVTLAHWTAHYSAWCCHDYSAQIVCGCPLGVVSAVSASFGLSNDRCELMQGAGFLLGVNVTEVVQNQEG